MVKICSVLMFAKGLEGCTAPQEEIDSESGHQFSVYSKKQWQTGALFSWVPRDDSMSFLILRQTHPQRNAGVLMPIIASKLKIFYSTPYLNLSLVTS